MKHIIAGVGLSLCAVVAQAEIKVTGQVVAPHTGDPVAGITIQAEHFEARNSGQEAEFQQQTHSGPDGRFEMRLPRSEEEQYTVFITEASGRVHEGYGHVRKDLDFGTVVLHGNCTLAGAVFIEDGGGAGGVPVLVEMRLKPFTCSHFIPAGETVTDADGAFRFEALAPGQYRSRVVSPDHAPAIGSIEVGDDLNYMEFILEQGATIRGRVLGPEDEPLPGLTVRSGRDRRVVSGEDGSYVLSGLGADRQWLDIESDDYALPDGQHLEVRTVKGETLDKDIRLVRAGTVVLTLVPEEDAAPPPRRISVFLSSSQPPGRMPRRFAFDQGVYLHKSAEVLDGKAQLTGIPAGTFDLVVSGEGIPDLEVAVTVKSGETVEAELSVPWTLDVAGRVVNERGEPLHEARISFSVLAEDDTEPDVSDLPAFMRGSGPGARSVGTDTDGRFSARNLTAGTYEMEIAHPRHVTRRATVVMARDSEFPDTFVLEDGLPIRGTVTNADGEPLVGAIIRASTGSGGWQWHGWRTGHRAESGADGSFVISGLSDGAYTIVVNDPEDEEELAAIDDMTAGTVLAFSIPRLRPIEVTVRLPGGDPAPGSKVTWEQDADPGRRSVRTWSGHGRHEENLTGANGRFSTAVREGVTYRFAASLAGYLPGTETVDLRIPGPDDGAQLVELSLRQGGTVRGVVLLEDTGDPVEDVIVAVGQASRYRFRISSDDSDLARTDPSGRFELVGVPTGVVKLDLFKEVEDGEVRHWGSHQVRSVPTEATETEIRIQRGGALRITTLDAAGTPVADAAYMLFSRMSPGGPYQADSDLNGIALIENVAPGEYQVVKFDPESGADPSGVPRIVTILSGETAELVFRDQPEADDSTPALSGTVTKDDAPFGESLSFLSLDDELDRAAMMAFYSGARGVELDENGAFSNLRLPPGRYLFVVSAPREQSYTTYAGRVEIEGHRTEYALTISGTRLHGAIRTPAGKPAIGARLYLVGTEGPRAIDRIMARRTQTDWQGQYAMEALMPGAYMLYVAHRVVGGTHEEEMALRKGLLIGADPDTQQFDVTLDPAFNLTGTLTVLDSDASEGAFVLLVDVESGERRGFATIEPDGSFRMTPAVAGGEYLVMAARDGYSVEARVLTLDADAVFDATLVPAGKVVVTVKGGEDWNPEGARLRLVNERGETVTRLNHSDFEYEGSQLSLLNVRPLDAHGRTEIGGLPPGSYTVGVEGQPFTATVEVRELETTRVVLQPTPDR